MGEWRGGPAPQRGARGGTCPEEALVPGKPRLRCPRCLVGWGRGVTCPPQVESWTKQDQKLLEAVERGDVGRVAALAARKAARPAKLNAAGQSAYVTPGRGDTRGSRALTWVTTPYCRPGSTWLRPGV